MLSEASAISRSAIPAIRSGSTSETKPPTTPERSFKSYLNELSAQWHKSSEQRNRLLAQSPDSVKPLLEAQIAIGRLDIQMQLVSRVAEAASSGTRRLQQMGGN